jgi:hypothetical protein
MLLLTQASFLQIELLHKREPPDYNVHIKYREKPRRGTVIAMTEKSAAILL